jgi:hypothetical protein
LLIALKATLVPNYQPIAPRPNLLLDMGRLETEELHGRVIQRLGILRRGELAHALVYVTGNRLQRLGL